MKSFRSLWVFILLIPHFVVAVGQADLLNRTSAQRKQLRQNVNNVKVSLVISKGHLHSFLILAFLKSKQLTPAQRDTIKTCFVAQVRK